jgi:hypothetical protein
MLPSQRFKAVNFYILLWSILLGFFNVLSISRIRLESVLLCSLQHNPCLKTTPTYVSPTGRWSLPELPDTSYDAFDFLALLGERSPYFSVLHHICECGEWKKEKSVILPLVGCNCNYSKSREQEELSNSTT